MARNNFFHVLSFFIFPAGIFFLSWSLDFLFDTYIIFPWIDIPMHFLGGFSVGYMSILFLRFFKEERLIEIRKWFVFAILIVSTVSLIAVLWEFWEFLMDLFFQLSFQLSLRDTLFDLFMGIIGGFFSAVIFRKI